MVDPSAAVAPVAVFNLRRLHIEDAVERFDLSLVRKGAFLMVRPATEANRGYQDAMLAKATKRTGTSPTPEQLAKLIRADDLDAYSRHVVQSWGEIYDAEGKAAPCTPENVFGFLTALPDWLFDRLRLFCIQPEKFIKLDQPGSAEALAGN